MTDPSPAPETPAPAQPWDRRPDEPPKAYARFLTYRNLGPARSVGLAYRRVAGAAGGGERRPGKAPGAWQRAAARFDWKARATAWDLHHLERAGQEAVAAFVAAVAEAAARTLRAIAGSDIRPKTWRDVLGALSVLAQLIPAETVAALSGQRPREG